MSSAEPVATVSFGCRLNALEGATMARMARDAGLDGLTIVNSCAVTAEAVRQAGQSIRRLKRDAPQRRIVVTGCGAQTETARFAAMPEVAHVIGNAEKSRAQIWQSLAADTLPRVSVEDVMQETRLAGAAVDRFEGRSRATLQVQNGCDHRCTFCIIPFGRGRSRSLPPENVVAEARRLVEAGHGEIVLTGVDLTAYGGDLPGGREQNGLGRLVRRILREVPELPRLRLSSVDGIEVDADLLRALADEPRLMPHLHLSLQAGDDLILKRMKRRHSSRDAIRFCDEVRRLRPDIVFGADLIAGFPTEDEAMFARSLAIIEACGLTHVHVFPYSIRPGTPAARMPQLPGSLVKERAARLRDAAAGALDRHCRAQVGRRHKVLAERGGSGHTEGFTRVRLRGGEAVGAIVEVAIASTDGTMLEAAA